MTHWLLIYWLLTGGEGEFGGLHSSTSVAEFTDEASCRSAFASMKSTKAANTGLWGVCVPKGAAQ